MYWSSLFMLPIHTCNEIEKLLKKFLWSRRDSVKGTTSVAWKDICKPKSQGGLGLKSAHFWNEALMVKHLWNIISRKISIWVRWVNIYWLKGRCIWDAELSKGYSWSWKNLLDLRGKVKRFVYVKIGNGMDYNIWFDKWNPLDLLSRIINHSDLNEANMRLKAKVNDMIKDNEWDWPIDWDDRCGE
nr:hypothetical protein [Tanacetum cinerariifolium]